jgi:hypothetical protein
MTVSVAEGSPVLQLGNLRTVATPFTAPESMRVTFIPAQGEVVLFELDDSGRPVRARYLGTAFERID